MVMKKFVDKSPYKWREQTVFISSTFRDFHAERDHLIKWVFPDLRQWCQKWKIHLVDIDLRWGITREQAESGKVIDLCLDQVDCARPFFLGMLSNRYGWVPEKKDIPAKTLKTYEKLEEKENSEISITHMEIKHAVLEPLTSLDKLEEIPHAFFYFRDPASVPQVEITESFPKEEIIKILHFHINKKEKQVNYYKKVITGYFTNVYQSYKTDIQYTVTLRNEEERDKLIEYISTFFENDHKNITGLKNLKDDIRNHYEKMGKEKKNPPEVEERIFEYKPTFNPKKGNPEDDGLMGRFVSDNRLKEFGERVKADLKKAISLQYAERIMALQEHREEDKLETEKDFHEAFVENRTRLFVGRTDLLSEVHNYINSDSNKILAVYGDPGSGKSSLLAKFYKDFKYDENGNEINPDVLFIPHFIGASVSSAGLHSMLNRFCEELKKKFDIEDEIPADINKLKNAFKDFLHKTKSQTIILIDGLNQQDELNQAHSLSWLPGDLPKNVKIIASTLEGNAKESLKKLTIESVEVSKLDEKEKKGIIRGMPSLFHKILEEKYVDQLIEKEGTSNPLYLKIATEELRMFGSFEGLSNMIEELPGSVIELLEFMIGRLENDFTKPLVKRLFCLLESSRYGLTESELKELLGEIDPDQNHMFIIRQIRDYLQYRENVICFFHRGLSTAIRQKYLGNDKTGLWHSELADYFWLMPLWVGLDDCEDEKKEPDYRDHPNIRKVSELPYHVTILNDLKKIEGTLLNLAFVEAKVRSELADDLLSDYNRVTALFADPSNPKQSEMNQVILRIMDFIIDKLFSLRIYPGIFLQEFHNYFFTQREENSYIQNLSENLERTMENRGSFWFKLTYSSESKSLRSRLIARKVMVLSTAIHSDINCTAVLECKSIFERKRGILSLWNIEKGLKLRTIGPEFDQPTGIGWLEGGDLIFVSERKGTGYILDKNKNKERNSWNLEKKCIFKSIVFTGENMLVTLEGYRLPEEIVVRDPFTGEKIIGGDISSMVVSDISICRNSKMVILAGSKIDESRNCLMPAIFRFNAIVGVIEEMFILTILGYPPNSFFNAIEVNDEVAVAGDSEGTIILLDIEKGNVIEAFLGEEIFQYHKSLRKSTGDYTPGHREKVSCLSISSDGKLFASSTIGVSDAYHECSEICFWNIQDRKLLSRDYVSYSVGSIKFLPQRHAVIIGSNYSIELKYLNQKKETSNHFHIPRSVNVVAFSINGDFWVSTDGTYIFVCGSMASKQIISFNAHAGGIYCIDCHPTEQLIASGGVDGHCKLWNAVSGELIKDIRLNTNLVNSPVYSLKFSPDGRILAIGHKLGCHLYDIQMETMISLDLPGKQKMYDKAATRFVDFAKNERLLLVGNDVGVCTIWDLNTINAIWSYQANLELNSAVFSSTGKIITVDLFTGICNSWNVSTKAKDLVYESPGYGINKIFIHQLLEGWMFANGSDGFLHMYKENLPYPQSHLYLANSPVGLGVNKKKDSLIIVDEFGIQSEYDLEGLLHCS